MPVEPDVLGFSSRWYPLVGQFAERRMLQTGRAILVPTPALLMACKLEAYEARGSADPCGSKGLEAIAALLDGFSELESSIAAAPEAAREWVTEALGRICRTPAASSALFA